MSVPNQGLYAARAIEQGVSTIIGVATHQRHGLHEGPQDMRTFQQSKEETWKVLSRVTTGLAASTPYVEFLRILPFVETNETTFRGFVNNYNTDIAEDTPEGGVSRILTSTQSQYAAQSRRIGTSVLYSNDQKFDAKGISHILSQIAQITASISHTFALNVINSIVNNWHVGPNGDDSIDIMRRNEYSIRSFGAWNKGPEYYIAALVEANDFLSERLGFGGKGADILMHGRGKSIGMNFKNLDRASFLLNAYSGYRAVIKSNADSWSIPGLPGVDVFEFRRAFKTNQFNYAGEYTPQDKGSMARITRVGEFYKMPRGDAEIGDGSRIPSYTSSQSGVRVFDMHNAEFGTITIGAVAERFIDMLEALDPADGQGGTGADSPFHVTNAGGRRTRCLFMGGIGIDPKMAFNAGNLKYAAKSLLSTPNGGEAMMQYDNEQSAELLATAAGIDITNEIANAVRTGGAISVENLAAIKALFPNITDIEWDHVKIRIAQLKDEDLNVIKAAIVYLSRPLNKKGVCFLLDRNTPLPFTFILAKHNITCITTPAFLAVSGEETGFTGVGNADYMLGSDVSNKTSYGHYTVQVAAVVKNSANIQGLPDSCVTRVIGGGSNQFYGRDEGFTEDHEAELNGPAKGGILIIPLQFNETDIASVFDITGEYQTEYYKTAARARGAKLYSSADFVVKYYGLDPAENLPPMRRLDPSSQNAYAVNSNAVNTLVNQGPYYVWNKATNDYTTEKIGQGHFGEYMSTSIFKAFNGGHKASTISTH